MQTHFRAVIFDLDGVLADSEPWWTQIDARLLAEHGVVYRGEHHQKVLGVSYRVAVDFYKKAFNLSAPVEELMRRRGEITAEFFANRVGLFPCAKSVLEQLRGMRLRLAVATSSVSASARPFLERHTLTPLFEAIVTGDEVARGKPHPDIYLLAVHRLGVPGQTCLVIEDALAGIVAAKAAGMRVAAIPDTRFVDPREYAIQADWVLGSLAELPELIRKANAAKGDAV